jgi:hypothetical protein
MMMIGIMNESEATVGAWNDIALLKVQKHLWMTKRTTTLIAINTPPPPPHHRLID